MTLSHDLSLVSVSLMLVMWSSVALAEEPVAPMTTKSNGYEFIITPYMWGPSVSGKVGVDGQNAYFDLPIDESIHYLQLGGMLGLEARRGRWGLLFDGVYMELEDDASAPGPFFKYVDVTYDQAWLDLGVTYRIFECDRGWIDLLAGGRYMYYSTKLGFKPDYDDVDALSQEILTKTENEVQGEVGGSARFKAPQISDEVSARTSLTVNELADDARIRVLREVTPRVNGNKIMMIVDDVGNHLSDGLNGRYNSKKGIEGPNNKRRTLPDTAMGAFETRIDRKIQAAVDATEVKVEIKAQELSTAVRNAIADRVREKVLAAGSAIEGDAAAIKTTVDTAIRQAASETINELKKNASAAEQKALDKAQQDLETEIENGMVKAADADVKESTDWVDMYVGARARWEISRRWYLGLRGDVGGFGIGSSSQLVWQLFGGAGFQFSERVALEAGWRYFDLDYDDGEVLVDMQYSGGTIGLSIQL